MRTDQGGPVPLLLLGGLPEAPRERVARALARCLRRVGQVVEGQSTGERFLGRDLAMGGSDRRREQLEQPEPRGHDRAAGIEERAVPVAQLIARGGFVADRTQESVALL